MSDTPTYDSRSPHCKVQPHRSTKLVITADQTPTMSGRFLNFTLCNGDRLAVLNKLVSGNVITTSECAMHEVSGPDGNKMMNAAQLIAVYECMVGVEK